MLKLRVWGPHFGCRVFKSIPRRLSDHSVSDVRESEPTAGAEVLTALVVVGGRLWGSGRCVWGGVDWGTTG